jgi:hypothetical protein
MAMRSPAGFISAFFDPLKNPDAPTIGTPTGDDQSVSVAFTAPTNVGGSAISSYSAISNPDGIIASASASPINVTGLTNGTAYTFKVWAINTYGPSAYSASTGSVTPDLLTRGLFGGGDSLTNVIDYINIASTANSTDFGDLLATTRSMCGCASSTRGIFAGGDSGGNGLNVIQYVTINTTGNATDFGDILRNGYWQFAACSSQTRGVMGGGLSANGGATTANTNYITIATTGNSATFGSLTSSRRLLASCGSTTRGVFGGGEGPLNTIDYITIATTGDATAFGDLTEARSYLQSCSNATRGLFAGGNVSGSSRNIIDYITIASTGNATDFGDLSGSAYVYTRGSCSSTTRAVFTGAGNELYNLGYVTIATTGNSSTFGNLSAGKYQYAGLSNCHGGI